MQMVPICLATLSITTLLGLGEIVVAQEGAPTQIDISVSGGSTTVLVYAGAATVCDQNGANCVPVGAAGCEAVVADMNDIQPVGRRERNEFVRRNFPFATNQAVLENEFRVNTSGCVLALLDPFARGISASPD